MVDLAGRPRNQSQKARDNPPFQKALENNTGDIIRGELSLGGDAWDKNERSLPLVLINS